MLLLLQFYSDHSALYLPGELCIYCYPVTKLEFQILPGIQEFHEFQITQKHCSSFSSNSIILNCYTTDTRYIVPPCNKAGICTEDCLEQIRRTVKFFSRALSVWTVRSFFKIYYFLFFIIMPHLSGRGKVQWALSGTKNLPTVLVTLLQNLPFSQFV